MTFLNSLIIYKENTKKINVNECLENRGKTAHFCTLNFSYYNHFVWEVISSIRHSVSSPDETPQSLSKTLCCELYFQLSSWCFISWWNAASHAWYITSWPLLDGILSLKNCRFFAFSCELPGGIYTVYFVNYKGKWLLHLHPEYFVATVLCV